MKRILIISGVIIAIIALIVFNKMISKKTVFNTYAEVKKGMFEITVSNSGELIAENSLDIRGPEIGQREDQGNQGGSRSGQSGQGGSSRQSSGGSSQSHGSSGGGSQSHGSSGGGSDMHAMDLKIQDIVPEGTIVKEGDYIAQLDRTSYENTLRDELEKLKTLQTNVEMKILDTAVVLTNLRDDIKNQRYVVEEAAITLAQSKFEPPATIRLAEANLEKAKRTLEQKVKSYSLRVAQSETDIANQKFYLERGTRLVTDLQEFLAKFTITAPSPGMVIYKKDRNGTKRKSGSNVNAFDRIIATLPDLSSMISKTYVSEIEISKVKIGQKVNITIDAFPAKIFTGTVSYIANVGEQLPNSDAKVFEVQIKVEGSDQSLRPSMTTTNRILIKTFNDVVYIPTECVHTGTDSVPFVYEKNKTRQVVVLGEMNEKNIIIEQGLVPGTNLYISTPENSENFRLTGEELIPIIKEKK